MNLPTASHDTPHRLPLDDERGPCPHCGTTMGRPEPGPEPYPITDADEWRFAQDGIFDPQQADLNAARRLRIVR